MKVKSESEVARSCPTLSDPMDCSLPGSSVHGIFQARVLEWSAIAFSNKVKGWKTIWYIIKLCRVLNLKVIEGGAIGKIIGNGYIWIGQWQPTPVLLPGESQGQRGLVGCHPWGRTETDMTEAT